ncbi:MAG: aldo/keto reductase [Acidobacteriota bacterium]
MDLVNAETCELAPGLPISRILTGLWQIADMEREGRALDLDAAAAAIPAYVEAGLTTFDMADHYGSAEEIVGRARSLLKAGDSPQVLTKWVPKPGPVTRNDVRAAVQTSLERLQMERLDLLQFHAWSYPDPSYLDALFYLQELQAERLIRHLGLTNFDTAHLRVVLESGIEVVSNQVCFSLLDQRAAGAMSALCLEHGIQLLAFGTLGGGLLTDRFLGRAEPIELATWSQMKYKRFLDVAGDWGALQNLLAVLDRVAQRHGVSIANVACRAILDQPAVGGIIVGARLSESEHIADNLRVFDLTLDDEDRREIDEALEALQPIPGDCGDEYRKPPFLTASGDLSHHLETFPEPYQPEERSDGRVRVFSGTPWEPLAGYCRAIRQGNRILVSGTTATHGDRVIGGSDPAAQTHFVIDKIEAAIVSLGGKLEDIVRTRLFIRHVDHWEPVSRAHGERFGAIQPANTLVRADLIGDEYLVEMEAEAVVGNEAQG